MTVLQEHPAALEDLGLGDQLLSLGPLSPPQGDHVQVQGTAPKLLGKPQQLGTRVTTYRTGRWSGDWVQKTQHRLALGKVQILESH